MQIILQNDALSDLYTIYNYIAKDSLVYAKVTIEKIYNKISLLEIFPYMGKRIFELPNTNFRELIYKSYRIVYEVFPNKKIVLIHFIIHIRRDLSSFYELYKNSNI